MRMTALLAVLLAPLTLQADSVRAGFTQRPQTEVVVTRNISYNDSKDASPDRHRLDFYRPKDAKNYPVFFFIHGGGWSGGNKDGFARHGLMFAEHGIGCVAINYRLSPGVQHPEHIKDVARAFAWTHANLAKHGADVNRIYVGGHSAGGHLAALLATDESYLKEYKLGLSDVKGVIPISGVFTIGKQLDKMFGDEQSRKGASPLTHVHGKLPPMLILYAETELGALGKQAEEFGEALKKAKDEVEVAMIANRDHGSIMGRIADANDPATEKILAFILKPTAR